MAAPKALKTKTRPTVAVGLVGSVLDAHKGVNRFEKWRPTVCLCQHPEQPIHRLELLHEPKFRDLAEFVAEDIRQKTDTKVVLHPIPFEDAWDFEAVFSALLDFSKSYPFVPDEEDYLVHITTGTHVAQICLFLLTESRHFPAKLVQTSPGRRGTPSPGHAAVIDLDLDRYDRLHSRFEKERTEGLDLLKSGIQTRNAGFNALIESVGRVALASDDPVLLTGPTGSGKSQLARRIFELKKMRRRVEGELVEVNCATLMGEGAMSALFGHVRGAFTGAEKTREGLLKRANRGVLFLDEIGELGLEEQAMLLRAIEEKTFLPVGADTETKSDFALIAGTNRDLRVEVAVGRFRDDLLARIDVWTFRLPALAERREDLAPNLEFELDRASARMKLNVTMSARARERFLQFAASDQALWLGNFRDFSASVTRMATLSSGGRIDVPTVEEEIVRALAQWQRPGGPGVKPIEVGRARAPEVAIPGVDLEALDPFDRVQLDEVIRVCRDARSLSEAGRTLFAVSRGKKRSSNDADRLRKYLARFGLDFGQVSRFQG